jgi:hypothetical protein
VLYALGVERIVLDGNCAVGSLSGTGVLDCNCAVGCGTGTDYP